MSHLRLFTLFSAYSKQTTLTLQHISLPTLPPVTAPQLKRDLLKGFQDQQQEWFTWSSWLPAHDYHLSCKIKWGDLLKSIIIWPVFPGARALKKTFGKSHVIGAVRVDVSGAVKTRTGLVVSARYISISVSDFFCTFYDRKIGSYDKMLIDWVGSGRTGKHLTLGHLYVRSVRTA